MGFRYFIIKELIILYTHSILSSIIGDSDNSETFLESLGKEDLWQKIAIKKGLFISKKSFLIPATTYSPDRVSRKYLRLNYVSLLSSEWDQVGPKRYRHRTKKLIEALLSADDTIILTRKEQPGNLFRDYQIFVQEKLNRKDIIEFPVYSLKQPVKITLN